MKRRRARPLKIVTVLGARPQFIKAAVVSMALKKAGIQEIIIHTGQHFDDRMSDIFFREMNIKKPRVNLNVRGGSHGMQTGAMLAGVERALLKMKPQAVLVYGDTNSTLAGALAAAKLCIPVVHIEAGLRSFNRAMPEELNRIATDHLADVLFCPNRNAALQLQREGLRKGVHVCGDVMMDALVHYRKIAGRRKILSALGIRPRQFDLLTVHRPVNADCVDHLRAILSACARGPRPVIFPVHPRTRQRATKVLQDLAKTHSVQNIWMTQPLGYLDMLCLTASAAKVLTDSGGLQKEALYLGTPCITLRRETEWRETLRGGWNRLVGADFSAIEKAMRSPKPRGLPPKPYGNGNAAGKIAQRLVSALR